MSAGENEQSHTPADALALADGGARAREATIHLRPTAPLAERVLLPGDPGRALALAQALLHEPRMFNHHRGLWGYTGAAADGAALTIQATGMGGPSAAIVFSELIALGVRRAIRVGSCGALDGSLALGELLVARDALCLDGSSRALAAQQRVAAAPELTEALLAAAPGVRAGTVASVDLFYDERPQRGSAGASGAVAVEMEAATLFALGARDGARVGCILAVSDLLAEDGTRVRIDDQSLLEAAERMGQAAVRALAR